MIPLILAFAAFQVSPQDEIGPWIARLSSPSLQEREEAAARLQDFGETGRPVIEAARRKATDQAVRERLDAVLARIQAEAELARIFSGPARRVTVAAKGWTLKEVLTRLIAPGVATVDSGDMDPESRIDIQLRSARWWEAWDRVASAAGGHFTFKESGDGRIHLALAKGKRAPGLYVDRFRIRVAEARRYSVSDSNGHIMYASVVVEVLHPPDLLPGTRSPETSIRIESVRDAEGRDARTDPPPWKNPMGEFPRVTRGKVWVRPDPGAMTLTGVTDIPFACDIRDLSMNVEGESLKTRVDAVTLHVESLDATREGTVLTLRAEAKEDRDLRDRLVGGSVALIDAEGRRHEGTVRLRALGDASCRYEVEFPPGISRARRATFRWVAAFHRVRIPFRFEDVRLPDFK